MKVFFHSVILLLGLCSMTLSAIAANPSSDKSAPRDKGTQVAVSTVNINTASAAQLSEGLSGIGFSKAQAIVDFRKTHGPFKSAEHLTAVKGIGERTIKRNQSRIRIK